MKSLIIVLAIVFICIASGVAIFSNNSYTIPENYVQKFEDHMSYVDGPNYDYYV